MSAPRFLLGFTVHDRARPKGSLTARPNGTMKESVDPEGLFRSEVCRAAWFAATGRPTDVASYRHMPKLDTPLWGGPVEMRMLFRFSRKPGHTFWAPADDTRGLAVGDIEKLVRNVHDALQDVGIFGDDAQVTTLGRVGKRFCEDWQTPSVEIEMWTDEQESAEASDEAFFAGGLSHVQL